MEVPCCSALPVIIEKAMDAAGKKISIEQMIISTRGELLTQEKIAA